LEPDPEPDEAISEDVQAEEAEPEPSDTLLINAAKGSRPSPLPPGDIRRVLSKNSKRSVSLAQIEKKVSYHQVTHSNKVLVLGYCPGYLGEIP
jgi:hypothetical protein